MSNKIRVLHVSTHNEDCGIAKFQEGIVDGLKEHVMVENTFFDVSPNSIKKMNDADFAVTINQLKTQLELFDVLHIQHEYSFYAAGQLQAIVNVAKALQRKVIFTLHTPPSAHRQKSRSITKGQLIKPRAVLHHVRSRRADDQFMADYITPLLDADVLVATSHESIVSFSSYGVPSSLIEVVELPVPVVDHSRKTTEISVNLRKTKEDIILSTVGFISETKGIIAAVKSLSFLPSKYKLAIIGGAHPSGQNDAFYDHVCDTIINLGLQDRVYITGYVADDSERDALVRETDISLYPYDRTYYDYVSSAAITNAVANNTPIVAYKTKTFLEANSHVPFITFAVSANYYELARSVKRLDIDKSKRLTKSYAELFSVSNQARKFASTYSRVLTENTQ